MDDPVLRVYEVWLIRQLAEGKRHKQIAKLNGMTPGAVTRCLSRLRSKCRAETNAHMVAWAYEKGVLP